MLALYGEMPVCRLFAESQNNPCGTSVDAAASLSPNELDQTSS